MDTDGLDDIDRRLLTLLQEDARYPATELAERIGVSDNTIHNRVNRLEEAGVITGYRSMVDHDRVGLNFHFLFICTARISVRGEVADRAKEIPEVVEVTELMTGQNNLQIKVVGVEDEDITRIAEQLDDLQLEINDETLIRDETQKPLDLDAIRGLSEE